MFFDVDNGVDELVIDIEDDSHSASADTRDYICNTDNTAVNGIKNKFHKKLLFFTFVCEQSCIRHLDCNKDNTTYFPKVIWHIRPHQDLQDIRKIQNLRYRHN